MAQITVEITQWLRAPTSSLSQDTPHYSTLNCFHSKNKQTNKKLLLHFKCRPLGTQPQCHPTKSTTPPGKQVGLGPQWPQAGLQAGTLGARAPCTANRRNLGQSSACEWVRWRVLSQQTASQSLSQNWRQMSNPTSVSSSQNKIKQLIHMFWEIKSPIYSANVSFLFHFSLTTSGHVLWTRVRKLLRRHSGHWVCDQKQDPGM